MDWRLAMEAEEAMLKRIVALLLALAGLAERASHRSQPVRGFVLWLLQPAEAVVDEFLTGEPGPIPLRRAGNSAAEAMRLAASLRSLAAALLDLSRRAFSCADGIEGLPECMGAGDTSASIGAIGKMPLRASSLTPPDTS